MKYGQPIEDPPESPPPRRRAEHGTWVPFVLLQFVGLVVCIAIIRAGPSAASERIAVPIVYGIFFGQLMLAAAATVLTSGDMLRRLTLPPLWIALEVLIALGLQERSPNRIGELLMLSGIAVFCWGVAQIPLWIFRWLTKARIRNVFDPKQAIQEGQFSIGQLLLFTLVVAVVLGVFRAFVDKDEFRQFFRLSSQDLYIFSVFMSGLAIAGVMVFACGLRPQIQGSTLAVALAGVVATLVVVYAALYGLQPMAPPDLEVLLATSIGGEAAWLAISLAALRPTGLRLM
jgi:hypothetical protein